MLARCAASQPADGLFWLYALLPVAVGFVAEQLRLAAAQTVLDAARARGRRGGRAPRRAPGSARSCCAILRREMGVMALAALVVAFLALRAWGTV